MHSSISEFPNGAFYGGGFMRHRICSSHGAMLRGHGEVLRMQQTIYRALSAQWGLIEKTTTLREDGL